MEGAEHFEELVDVIFMSFVEVFQNEEATGSQ
jgi:hypothetical protein